MYEKYKKSDNNALQKKIIDKLENKELYHLILGSRVSAKRSKVKKWTSRGIAIILWMTSFILMLILGGDDALGKIMSLATLGLILVFWGNSALSSYKGPVWPIGRPPQRIDKPTPKIILLFFGWILLIVVFIIFMTMLLLN